MAEAKAQNNQQIIVIALVVIAVLLAAIVGIMIYNQNKSATPVGVTAATNVPAPTGTNANPGSAQAQAPAGMGAGSSSAAPTAFDPKTATKVPAGMTPEQALKTYNEDILAGKFEEAYKLLPADKQASYGDAKAYGEQVKAYGITSYELGKPTTKGDTVTITSTQVTPQMPIGYTWTFKKVGDQWYVASRQMGGL